MSMLTKAIRFESIKPNLLLFSSAALRKLMLPFNSQHEHKEELMENAKTLSTPGRGIFETDESN